MTRKHDPYGSPRPAPGQEHVPLRTSFYVELAVSDGQAGDRLLEDTVAIVLELEGANAIQILKPNREFAPGYTGRLFPGKNQSSGTGPSLLVYVDPEQKLVPATRYTIRVTAQSRDGAELPAKAGTWQFTTEELPEVHPLTYELSLTAPAVHWHGAFFSGFCGTSFCTNHLNRIPTFELMDEVRKDAPKAWSLQRDFWLTGMDHQPVFLSPNLPNLVRERETRRVTKIDKQADGMLLHVEDFFGHEQYAIESGRPLSADYHEGDEVLIADGVHDARAKVISANDRERTVLVGAFDSPSGGWKLAYAGPLPKREDPNAPGLFPPGGCYLLKFSPSGTPAYYWGRLEREWDLAHRRFQRRILVNFTDAPGDLSIDGRNWTTAKDYAELHTVVRAITSHIIERYGDACLEFPWSVFNEPDLGVLFWRTDWDELQKFYDYTVDAILRAFEDHGYDSDRVFVGGLELGGIFGTNLRLREFLVHCSPRAPEVKGSLVANAAFADPRLDGKRSMRVEKLCRAHAGRGSPCDFISIHAYNTSKLMADKLARAKEMALEVDAEQFAKLWINSHESCPGWDVPPDPAYSDSYLGNGYFETWCADVARRQLARAAADPRYGFGESILTFWPWPISNFEGRNDCVRQIQVDDDGNGVADRSVTVPMPILHFLGLMNSMGDDFRVLPEFTVGGQVVSGFASQSGETLRILLYAHHMLDTESRSEHSFDVTLDLSGLKSPDQKVSVREFRFDKDQNSYFHLGRSLRDQQTHDQRLLEQTEAALKRKTAPPPFSAEVARKIEELAELRENASRFYNVGVNGQLSIEVPLSANGVNFLIIEPTSN